MTETKTTRDRTSFMIAVSAQTVVTVNVIESTISAISGDLGYTKTPADGKYGGKTLVGNGREDALINGCFPIAVYYQKNNKERRTVLLVSPTKADTIATTLKGKTYSGNTITKVRPVRRRKYTYY